MHVFPEKAKLSRKLAVKHTTWRLKVSRRNATAGAGM
jgi:hypothetical protein